METTLPGVYAAGDVAGYEGKITLITIGLGEAAIAANHAVARSAARRSSRSTRRTRAASIATLAQPERHARELADARKRVVGRLPAGERRDRAPGD